MSEAAWPELETPIRVVPPEHAYHGDHPPTLSEELHKLRSIKTIDQRILHSDKYRSLVRGNIAEILHEYFDFPTHYDSEGPFGGPVPHVVQLLEQMFEGGSLCANWSTDHAKSLTSSYFFPLLSLMENPDESHIIVGANFNDSKRRLQMIQRTLEGAREPDRKLLRDFPWLKRPPKESEGGKGGSAWSRTELTVSGRSSNRPNPSIYACATGSNDIRGRRGKLIMDDIEGIDVRHSMQKRQEIYEFVKYEAIRCWEDTNESSRPLLIALGTPFDQDSLYFKLRRDQWKMFELPAYTVDWKTIQGYQPYGKTAGNWQLAGSRIPAKYFNWPFKRMKVLLHDPYFGHKMNKTEFSLNYLLDPSAGDPSRLSLEEIERLMRETEFPAARDWKTLVSIDPASGSRGRQADYCGISVVRIRWARDQKLPEVQVLEAHQFETGIIEQVKFAGDLAARYECDVIYESNAQQKGNYRDTFKFHRPETRLVEFYTKHENKVDTEMGLTVIRTLVRSGKLQVPESTLDSEGIAAFMREIRDLGGDGHDHLSCSVWFVVRWLYEQVRGMNAAGIVLGGVRSPFAGSIFAGNGTPSWRTWRRR